MSRRSSSNSQLPLIEQPAQCIGSLKRLALDRPSVNHVHAREQSSRTSNASSRSARRAKILLMPEVQVGGARTPNASPLGRVQQLLRPKAARCRAKSSLVVDVRHGAGTADIAVSRWSPLQACPGRTRSALKQGPSCCVRRVRARHDLFERDARKPLDDIHHGRARFQILEGAATARASPGRPRLRSHARDPAPPRDRTTSQSCDPCHVLHGASGTWCSAAVGSARDVPHVLSTADPVGRHLARCSCEDEDDRDSTRSLPPGACLRSRPRDRRYHGVPASAARRRGLETYVLGLSGGVDSACAAALAARAVGPERLVTVKMPSQTSSPESRLDAEAVEEALGVPS